jgi:hypothetical protein
MKCTHAEEVITFRNLVNKSCPTLGPQVLPPASPLLVAFQHNSILVCYEVLLFVYSVTIGLGCNGAIDIVIFQLRVFNIQMCIFTYFSD